VREAYAKTLEEKVKAKVADPNDPERKKQIVKELTRAELIALNMAECAASDHRNNVTAARELRLVVEPIRAWQRNQGPTTISMLVIHEVFRKAGKIDEKPANAHELPAE
jgi:hypothetical protein